MTKFIARLIVLLAITIVSTEISFAQLGTVPTLASSNVSEASQYGVVYAIDLPTNAGYSTQSAINYAVNNSGVSGISFKRVAYFMQLDSKWVWASMDKFNANLSLTDLGIPASNSSVGFQQVVTNLHVYGSAGSNVTNVTADGTNGNVEIWPQCYSQGNSLSGIGGNSGTFDFNDTRSGGAGCYGSFQVHNYGASQTLFAFNNFISSGINDQGIGNNSGNANPDWTFMANANTYTTRKLYIMVDYGISSPSPSSQALCINATPSVLTVNAVAQTGTTISSYNWYSNTTNSSTGGTLVATHSSSATSDTYTPATASSGTTYYYVTMTNSAGTVVTGGTATVAVNPYPSAFISGTNEVCLNTTSPNVTFTGATGTAPYTFTYNINGSTNTTVTSSGNTATVAAPTSVKGIYTYNLIGVRDAATSACYQTQSGSAIITIDTLPTATITAGSATTFCTGGSVTLTSTPGVSYLWSNNATTQSAIISTAGNYTVRVTDGNGCFATSSSTAVTLSATNTITLTSLAATTTQTVYTNTAITNITYSTTGATGASFSGLPTGVTGLWSGNLVTISGTPSVSGVYNYTVTLTGGCGTVTATGSITAASVSITSNISTICAGTSVTFTATPTAATNPTYQWTKNGTAIAGATNSTYTTSTLANNDVIAVNMTISNATGGNVTGVVTSGLSLYLNAKNTTSYPGTGTTWYDISGNNYNSTLSNVTYANTNRSEFSFNGSNSIVKTPSIPNTGVGGGTSVTWSAWVYPTTNSGTIMYMSSDVGGGGWNMPPLYFTNKRFIGSVYNNSTISDVTDFTLNTWYNVTLVYDGSARTSKLYVNGALVNSATNQTFSGPGSTAYMFLGLVNGGCCNNGNNFTGKMSSFMAYGGKALTAAEVLQNYNNGVTASITSNTISTTVNPLPTATIGGTTAVCVNATSPNVTFTGTAGSAPFTFTYKINGGADQTITTTSGNAVTVAAPTSATGTYVYSLVSVQDASSTTCSQTQSGTATITVNPYPTAFIAGNNEVCKNASSPNITFTGATGTAPYTFTYNINGGSNLTVNSSGNTATVAAVTTASGIYNFNLVGVRDAATSACYQTQSGLATITIDTLPAATISAASATSFCPGGSVTLTATPGVSYLWSNNATTQSTTVSTAGNYTVKVTDGKGCFATSSATAVSIYSLPVVNAITQPGQFGNGLNFDGSNDYVNLTRTIQDDFTIEFWMKTTQTGNSGSMWYSGMGLVDAEYPGGTNDFGVTLLGNKVAFGVGNPDYTIFSTSVVNTGNWVHVAATRNKATGLMQLYINGVLESSYTQSNHGSLNVPSYIYLGRDNNGTFFNGTLDEVRLWNIVRTSQDINNNMNSELTGTPSGLVNYFKFDQGVAGGNNSSVTTLTDAIGSNNQSLLNFALSGATSNWVAGATSTGGSGSQGNVCINSTLQLSNTTTGGVWTSSNTAVATVNTSGLVAGVSAGSATITYTVTNSNNCTTAVTTSVTVNPLPTASISGTTTVKKGDASPVITLNGANGTAPYTFTYTINGGTALTVTSSGNTATVSAPTNIPGAFDYALVSVKDASGSTCSNTASGVATITVNPLQGVISGTTSVCQNATSPTITIVGSYGTAPYTFTYNINGGSTLSVISVGNTATVTVPTTTAGTYAYNLLSVQDASALFSATSSTGTATITVKPQPTPTITGQTFACGGANGTTVSYTANGGVSYAWDNGLTPNAATNTFTTATSYTATVTATATNGCTNTAAQVIPANTAPTISTIADTTTLVETAVASTFTIGDAETAGNLTITKSSSNTTLIPNNKIVITGTGFNRTITVTPAQDQIGTATISVTVTDCGGLSTTTSYVVTVNEPQYAAGVADFVIRKTVSKIDNCSDSVYFVNRSYNGANATYQWYINGNTTTMPSFLSSAGGLVGYKTALPGTYTAMLVVTEPGVNTYSVTKTFTLTKGIVPVPSPSFNFGYINVNGAGTASVVAYPTTPYIQGGVVNYWTITPATNITYEATTNAPTLTVTQISTPQTFNVTLWVSATNGCERYPITQQLVIPAYSRIVPNFSVNHTRSVTDGCNDSVTFINTSAGGVGGNTYTWYLGDGTTIVTTSTAPIGKVYTYPGTYTILMNAVDNTGQSVSHQFTITTTGTIPAVTAKPVIYASATATSSNVILDGGTSTIAYGGLNYQWTLAPTVGGVASYSTASVPLTINRTNVDQTFTAQLTVTDTTVGCRTNTASQTFVVPKLAPVVSTPTAITADFSISVTKSVVDHCNDSVYITNTTTGGAGTLTYTWYLGDGTTINTTSTAVIGKIYNFPGTYTVLLNVTDTAGQTAAKQLTVTTVGTIPAVTAIINLYGPSNATTVSTVMLNAGNSTIANGSLDYTWTVTPAIGGAASYSTSSISLPINRSGIDQSFTAHLSVSDALTGCRTSTASQSFTVPKLDPVYTAPTAIIPDYTVHVRKSIVDACSDSIYIVNNTSGGEGTKTYTWYFGDGSSITTTSTATVEKVYSFPGTYNILLNVTDTAGQTASLQKTVTTIGAIPAVTASAIVYGPYNTAASSTLTLDGGNSTIAYGSLSYQWIITPTIAGVASYASANVPLTIDRTNADQTFTAQLTVKDAATSCKTSTASQTFIVPKLDPSDTAYPTISADFTINVTKSVVDGCNDSVYITNNSTGGAGTLIYNWYLGDGSSLVTTSTAVIGKIFTYPGTYTILLNVHDSLNHYVSAQKSIYTVGTIPAVNAVATIHGPSNTDTTSDVLLNAGNSTTAYGLMTYLWTITPATGIASSFNTASVPLSYIRQLDDQSFTAVLTVQDSLTHCRTSTATQTFIVPMLSISSKYITGTNKVLGNGNKVQVYPNPSANIIHLKISLANETEGAEVRIFNAMGMQVATHKLNTGKTKEMSGSMSIASLASGTYYLKVFSNTGELLNSTSIVKF